MQSHIKLVKFDLPYLNKETLCPHEMATVGQVVSKLFMTVEQFMTLIGHMQALPKTGSLDRALRMKCSALHLRTRRNVPDLLHHLQSVQNLVSKALGLLASAEYPSDTEAKLELPTSDAEYKAHNKAAYLQVLADDFLIYFMPHPRRVRLAVSGGCRAID